MCLSMQDLGFNASNMEVKVLIRQQVPEIAQVCVQGSKLLGHVTLSTVT
jgi:hypothetical protein